MVEFSGAGAPLSEAGVDAAVAAIGVAPAALWAVIAVETSGAGFLADRRPKILFERHIFSRLTGGRFDADDPDVSARTPGGYGPAGAHQYDRLQAAVLLDRSAALQSASWGLGQIMGENYAAAGFRGVEDLVEQFAASEDAQLAGMASFIAGNGLGSALSSQDWSRFARLYNGPNYAANSYDTRLHSFYQKYSDGPGPDLTVRAIQLYLNYQGFGLAVDGVVGPATRQAVSSWQGAQGLPVTGVADEELLQQLVAQS